MCGNTYELWNIQIFNQLVYFNILYIINKRNKTMLFMTQLIIWYLFQMHLISFFKTYLLKNTHFSTYWWCYEHLKYGSINNKTMTDQMYFLIYKMRNNSKSVNRVSPKVAGCLYDKDCTPDSYFNRNCCFLLFENACEVLHRNII